MCTGFPPAAFCNHCKEFKLPDMRNLYERERLSKFEKKKKKKIEMGTQSLQRLKKD